LLHFINVYLVMFVTYLKHIFMNYDNEFWRKMKKLEDKAMDFVMLLIIILLCVVIVHAIFYFRNDTL